MVATSLGQYLSIVSKVRKRWKVPAADELWFRAEDAKHSKTHLQPGLYRPRDSGKRKSIKRLLDLETELYEEFPRCATQLSDVELRSGEGEWNSYFLMQHHGIPTRLLDWSDGALIALHFAISRKPRPPKSGSIVFVLDPYWLLDELDKDSDRADAKERWNRYLEKAKSNRPKDDWERLYLPGDDEEEEPLLRTPEIPLLWDSPHVTRRVAAQRSRFMIFGTDPTWLSKLLKRRKTNLTSITIPRGSITRITQELRDAGVTDSVVFHSEM
jgi:hypothetical protein